MGRRGPIWRSLRGLFIGVLQFSMRLARIPARILLRLMPRRAGWLREVDILWQPVHGRIWHELLYRRRVDPYGFATNPYETAKYRHTMEVLGGRTYLQALEIGCAEGVFTEMLAPRCAALLAIDTSSAAVHRARRRLKRYPHVRIERAWIPSEMPSGPFDLIVCSDVLYYLPTDVLADFAVVLRDSLSPGGRLLALHYRGHFGQAITGDEVHSVLTRHTGLPISFEVEVDDVGPDGRGYRITRFDRPAIEVEAPAVVAGSAPSAGADQGAVTAT